MTDTVTPPVTEPTKTEGTLLTTEVTTPATTTTPTTTTPDGDKGNNTPPSVELFDPAKVRLPDGLKLDEGLMKEFLPLATELKLSHEHGQKYIDLYTKGIQAAATKLEADIKAEAEANVEKWRSDTKTDKEIGGAKLQETSAVAGKAIARFGTPELKQLLNDTGLGDHPEFVRAFYKIGKMISEDSLGGKITPLVQQQSAASILYDNPTSKAG